MSGHTAKPGMEVSEHVGKTRWDLPSLNPDEAAWARHRAQLERHEPFHDFQVQRPDTDGKLYWASISGEPVFDFEGRFTGYRGVGKDISASKREEQLLALEHSVARDLADATAEPQALRTLLGSICGAENWECGRYFGVDEGLGRMRFQEGWATDGPMRAFLERSKQVTFEKGEGLVGEVWARCEPIWIADGANDPRVKMKQLAREAGVHGVLVHPVAFEGRVIGVLSFSSGKLREPDERLLQTLRIIGAQLGQFLRRKQGEEAVRRHGVRLVEVIELQARLADENLDVEAIANLLVEKTREIVGIGAVVLQLVENDHFVTYAATPDAKQVIGEKTGLEGSISSAVLKTGAAIRCDDTETDPRANVANGRRWGVRSLIGAPVQHEGRVIGVLKVTSPVPHGFGPEQVNILELIAGILGSAIQRKRAAEALQRFRVAMDNSADMIVLIDRASMKFVDVNSTICRLLGYSREEMLALGPQDVLPMSRTDLERDYDALISGKAAVGGLGSYYRRKDGSRLPFESTRHVLRSGDSWLISAISRDVSERVRAERMLALEHAVTRVLAETEDEAGALREVIREVCETEGWDGGRYLHLDESGAVMRFRESWSGPSGRMARFVGNARLMSYQPGVGLIGKAWQGGEPLWTADSANDPRVAQPALAVASGLPGGYAFPVSFEGRICGVLAFASVTASAPGERLLQAMRVIGSQLGQFLTRKQAEAALSGSEARFRKTFELAAAGMAHVSLGGRYLRVNRKLAEILGYTEEELLARTVGELSHPDDREAATDALARLRAGEVESISFEKRYLRKNDSVAWVSVNVALARNAEGEAQYEISVYEDISERKRSEERRAAHVRYQESTARFGQSALGRRESAELVDDAVRGVLDALRAGAVVYLERGLQDGQLLVRGLAGIAGEHDAAAIASYGPGDAVSLALDHGELALLEGADSGLRPLPYDWAGAFRCTALVPVHGDGEVRGALCALSATPHAFGSEESKFLVATASVLSAGLLRIESEGRLAFLAQFDVLTGLPNRALLADRFSQLIVQARRHDTPLGVLFIDLDDFKTVNDTLGHAGGDELLKETARRLQSVVRPGDTVARISGDEFAVILSDLAKADDAAIVAQKIIDRLALPIQVRDQEVFVTASIGIAAFPPDGDDAETLLGAADAAMYRAKQSGRNGFQFFTADINQRTRARAQLGSELRRALERDEFALVYQPKYDLRTGRPCAAEALLRWQHPERGIVSPVEFIPVLEETGLIVQVGEWVLRRVCEDLKAWETAGLKLIPLAVNLSARQFRQQDLDVRIRKLVHAAGVDPSLIELEITESQLMQDPEHAKRMMEALAAAGLRVAIDDFGTGYSSLSYLTRFPLSALKIDRSFVADVLSDQADAAIVRTIIDMAHTLGFIVIAEGVETEAQATLLRSLGCEQAQGYYFAKPMPEADLRALISSLKDEPPGKGRFAARYQ
jgi:diguanylate cyclase (GGDEF)-like protein/PAS domain S-box-containing protein